MKKLNLFSKVPYHRKMTVIILLFACIPSLLFGAFYYKSVRPQWIQTSSLVDMGITPHTPIQNRTCPIKAYGFSLYIHTYL